ncbi:AfsR/SARP family transcriptional regulator [Microbispora siamensis]
MLARLLVAGGRLVHRNTLIEDVYDGDAPPSAVSTLQSHVSHLRRAIEPGRARGRRSQVLVGRPAGYQLTPEWVDAARFAELVDAAEFLPPARALESVQEALRLWRPPGHCRTGARILHLLARGRHEEAHGLAACGWPSPPSLTCAHAPGRVRRRSRRGGRAPVRGRRSAVPAAPRGSGR